MSGQPWALSILWITWITWITLPLSPASVLPTIAAGRPLACCFLLLPAPGWALDVGILKQGSGNVSLEANH